MDNTDYKQGYEDAMAEKKEDTLKFGNGHTEYAKGYYAGTEELFSDKRWEGVQWK